MLNQVFNRLLAKYGPQGWWPAAGPEEMIVGAILTQNTNWRNVEKALRELRLQTLLNFSALAKAPLSKIEKAIRPAGYFRQKSRRLQNLARSFLEAGGLPELQRENTLQLRQWLLAINGVGPETADSILLYAFDRPVFVIDAYTLRICRRHGWLSERDGYQQAQNWFESSLPREAQVFNEFHALLVIIGKDFCKARKTLCQQCPLANYPRPQAGS